MRPGLIQRLSRIPDGARIVCTVTGHGLKDPDIAKDRISGIVTASPDKRAILDILEKSNA